MHDAIVKKLNLAGEPTELMLSAEPIFDLRAAAEGEEPRRPSFAISAYTGGKVRTFGFRNGVVIDLAGLRVNKTLPILLDHDASQIVGQANEVEVTDSAVKLSGVVTGDYTRAGEPAEKVVQHARGGFKWAASVGVGVEKLESVGENASVNVNGKTFAGPLYVVRAGRLGEVSFVAIGADEKASAKVAASAAPIKKGQTMKFEQWLEAKGFDAAALTDEQKTVLQAAFDAEQKKAPAPAQPAPQPDPGAVALNAVLAAEKAKRERENQVTQLTASYIERYPSQFETIEALSKQAIAAGWEPSRLELEFLRSTRPVTPAAIPSRGTEANAETLEAALCLAGGLKNPDKHFSAQALEQANRRWRHGISLQQFIGECARRNGFGGGSVKAELHEALRCAFAFERQVRASGGGVSSLDISGILSTVANKFLRQGFDSVESAWQQIAAIRPVSDFKTHTTYSLTGAFQYEKVAPSGELTHGKIGEQSYTNRADTYGKMMVIDRRDFVNDDLGALSAVPNRLGRGAALALNHIFWTAFLDNASFFASGNANYISGADTVLSIASLTAAETKFRKQTDPDGKPMAISPRVLLVPAELAVLAQQLMGSLEYRELQDSTSTGAAAKQFATMNPFVGKYRPVSSAYLSNTAYTGYSLTAWYLLADPMDVPVIEVAFLNGQQTPTIESAQADFNVLGIQMRGYHDFGVSKQEYRGGVKSKGAA